MLTEHFSARWGLLADAAVVALLVILARTQWVLEGMYLAAHPSIDIAIAVATLFITVLAALAVPALLLPVLAWQVVLRVLIMLVVAYVLQASLRQLPFAPQTLTLWHKAIAILVSTVLAWAVALRCKAELWGRLKWSLVTAAVLYALSPLAWALLFSPNLTLEPSSTLGDATKPRVVIVLDEFNVAAAEPVVAALRNAGASVHAADVKAVGENTIHVLPQMFGSPAMPSYKECSPTALCDDHAQFDFARLRFKSPGLVHIVGFFHPYCASNGWASCTRIALPNVGAIRSLLCSFKRLMPLSADQCVWMEALPWSTFQAQVLQAVVDSDFWKRGGFLFAHVPLPHPPGDLPAGSLAEDYEANLRKAADFATQLWREGRALWGADFEMVITSDHPLRPALWCTHIKYAQTGCQAPRQIAPGRVPYLRVGGKADESSVPQDNARIFRISDPKPGDRS